MRRNSEKTYGVIARVFHWVTAIVVVALFVLGLWMVDLSYYSEWYKKAPDIHKSIGILLTLFVIGRLMWRLADAPPAPLSTHKEWEKRLAHVVHWVLYLGLFSMFVSGYLISTAKGQALDVFNWFSIPAVITGDSLGVENLEDLAGEIHEILAFGLIGLAAMHALAAFKHHIIDKDSTLLRMLGKE